MPVLSKGRLKLFKQILTVLSLTDFLDFRSPGFGLTLVAETTNGVFLCAESTSNPKGSESGVTVPEDLGKNTAILLLQEIYKVLIRNYTVHSLFVQAWCVFSSGFLNLHFTFIFIFIFNFEPNGKLLKE